MEQGHEAAMQAARAMQIESLRMDEQLQDDLEFLTSRADVLEVAFHEAITRASEGYDTHLQKVTTAMPTAQEKPEDRNWGIIHNLRHEFNMGSNELIHSEKLFDIIQELNSKGVLNELLGDAELGYDLATSINPGQSVKKVEDVKSMLVVMYKHNTSPKQVIEKINSSLKG